VSIDEKKQSIIFHLFVIRTQNRIDLQDYLHQNGIQTVIHYPVPPHNQRLCHFEPFVFPDYPKKFMMKY
jgi:dTDP-4-amino-4,6-dideoxygalactose transaminase